MTTIGFIGVGEIASAIVDGLRSQKANGPAPGPATGSPAIVLSPRSVDRSAALAAQYEAVEVAGEAALDEPRAEPAPGLPQRLASALLAATHGVVALTLGTLLTLRHGPRRTVRVA